MNTTKNEGTLSVECALGEKPGYSDVHTMCKQTRSISLPHSRGILLQPRCTCACHKARQ